MAALIVVFAACIYLSSLIGKMFNLSVEKTGNMVTWTFFSLLISWFIYCGLSIR